MRRHFYLTLKSLLRVFFIFKTEKQLRISDVWSRCVRRIRNKTRNTLKQYYLSTVYIFTEKHTAVICYQTVFVLTTERW